MNLYDRFVVCLGWFMHAELKDYVVTGAGIVLLALIVGGIWI